MNAPSRRARILSLIQLMLLLPPMVSGSICISADGSGGWDLGFCACTLPFVGITEAAIGMAGVADCGPCRDEAFSALRSSRPTSPCSLGAASPATTQCVTDVTPSIIGTEVFWAGEPPGARLPILRC